MTRPRDWSRASNITGPYIGQIPDRLVPMFNPASKEVGDQVEEAIQTEPSTGAWCAVHRARRPEPVAQDVGPDA